VSGPVKAYDAKLYGESTRVFPFDEKRGRFFFFDIDEVTAKATSPITMYTIDPATGESTSSVVSGVTGPVRSFDYHSETGTSLLAVGNRTSSTFSTYSVNLATAVATKVASHIERGASESASAAFYGAYISNIASNGSALYRLGYKSVSTGQQPGLGTTFLDSRKSVWRNVPNVAGEDFYYSLSRMNGSDTFVSLAPSASLNHTLAVYSWSATDATATLLLDVPDAHPPSSSGTGILGYVADTVAAGTNTYAALVVKKNPSVLPGAKDKWEVITVDLDQATGQSREISGKGFEILGAETVSISGIGIMQ
jgi:hypothetical protein